MSLADKKRSVFTTIGSYTSMIDQGEPALSTDSYSSINNGGGITSFLLDVTKTVAGSGALNEIIGGLFSNVVDEAEPQLKTSLKKQFIQGNANAPLPSDFRTNGIKVPVKDMDVSGKLKENPDTATGGLLYGSNDNFDKKAYSAILNEGDWESYNNVSMKYNSSGDEMQLKPNIGTSSMTIGEYFTNYIDDTTLIDKKVFVSSVMDGFYGTVSASQNKTVEQLYMELQVGLQLEQLINDDNDSFEVSPDKYDELLEKAKEMSEGLVNYDLGCGMMGAELDFDDLNSTISDIVNSTDPFYIGAQVSSTLEKSTNFSNSSEDLTTENKETMKDGFLQRIINIATVKLLESVTTTPQIRALFAMSSALENDGTPKLNSPTEDMKNFKTCIKCMSNEIKKMVARFIFELAISYLIKLLKPVVKKVVREKINQYVGVMSSLTGTQKLTDTLT